MKQQRLFPIPENKKTLKVSDLERMEGTISPTQFGDIMEHLLSREDVLEKLYNTRGLGAKSINSIEVAFSVSQGIKEELRQLSEVGVRVVMPK